MSKENVEIVRRTYEAWRAIVGRDLSRDAMAGIAAEFFDPEVQYLWHGGQLLPDTPQHVRGISVVAGVWEQMLIAWPDLRLALLECIEAPNDRVVALVRQTGRGRDSGVPIEAHMFQVVTIQDGLIQRARNLSPSRRRP